MTQAASTITLNQLESHLWESANILRGPVDAADFKTYIFPLLFFKRICDVWDEEYQEIVDETGDEQLAWFPESHRFQIPEDCHWNDVRTKASNVGTALQRAMREIEKANPDTLYGVFGDAQWSNKDRLSDALLKDLIEHFSKLPFGNKNVNSDLLGDAYEYLIKKFADATNKKAGEFYTPRSVVRLMIDMLDPKEAETIYDPACGTGGMLLAAVQHVKEQHGDVKRLWGKLYGQEKNLAARKGKVIFIDAVAEVTRERAQSFLKPEHQQRILSAYQTFADVPGFAKVATLAEIGANAGNLSIPLYVKRIAAAIATDSNGDAVSLRSAWDQWQTDGRAFWQQMDTLVETLDGL